MSRDEVLFILEHNLLKAQKKMIDNADIHKWVYPTTQVSKQ